MLKVIMFDFDGVITDTSHIVYRTFAETYPDLTLQQFRDLHEGNIYDNMKAANMNEDLDELNKRIGDKYGETELVPIMKDTIRNLSKEYKLYIVTSGTEENIKKFLKYHDLENEFKEILGMKTHFSKVIKMKMILEKENITHTNTIFITDTLGDIREANQLNISTIAVTWGTNSEDTLRKGNPNYVINKQEELLPTIIKHNKRKK